MDSAGWTGSRAVPLIVRVDGKSQFILSGRLNTEMFWFDHRPDNLFDDHGGKDGAPHDAKEFAFGSLSGLQSAMAGHTPFILDENKAKTLGQMLPSGSYDIVYSIMWPQLCELDAATTQQGNFINNEWKEMYKHTYKRPWPCLPHEEWSYCDASDDDSDDESDDDSKTEVDEGAGESPSNASPTEVDEAGPKHYYRCWGPYKLTEQEGCIRLMVTLASPLQHSSSIDPTCVERYKKQMMEDCNLRLPTVLAVGIFNSRETVVSGVDAVNYVLNFVIDGHHKMLAAAQVQKPIGMLTFFAKKEFGLGSTPSEERQLNIINELTSTSPLKKPSMVPHDLSSRAPRSPPYQLLIGPLSKMRATADDIIAVLKAEGVSISRSPSGQYVVIDVPDRQSLVALENKAKQKWYNAKGKNVYGEDGRCAFCYDFGPHKSYHKHWNHHGDC